MTEIYKSSTDLSERTNDHSTLKNPYKVRKKPIIIDAYRITWDNFQVKTLEGTMLGNKGDWLLVGAAGELYIIKNEIFDNTFDIIVNPTK